MKSINSPADINVSRILRLIWQSKGISRIEIANELGIDKSTVTKITASLSSIGLISETSHGVPGPLGGRKPVYLEITNSFACVGGVEINPERFVCCLLDLHGIVLFQYQENVQPHTYERLRCDGIFFKAFEMIAAEAEMRGIPLIGVGVGVPAMVNSDDGTIIQSVPLMIDDPYRFVESVSEQIDVPVFLENDARCCCYSEKMLSNDRGTGNMLFVLTEYRVLQPKIASKKNLSVGMGIVINGQIYKGNEGSAGEFRSILWESDNAGQFFSGEDRLETISFENASMESVFFELARHVAFLVNILNLEVVYIGGIESEFAERIAKIISSRIEFQWPYHQHRKYEVRVASLGHFAVSYGAAAMVVEDLFALPTLASMSGTARSMLETFSNLRQPFNEMKERYPATGGAVRPAPKEVL
ncbi:ROK family transcriptional regulator [Treponema brennaborense]|uniref:ROK family protein n=1 Tax=Treponema brennaborense (strain DSM 12168 / CIP 105900 / DD5/3) TaxID=906968 RepID=F4LJQ6_TREBD|nr:ROK family transcriptional regulator [Treponema brennaborense]AEE17436.1 ROK family protein [Treponema brennaborense DSM 12168]